MAEPSKDRKEVFRSISRYCDYQERCIQEVRLKLKRLGVTEADMDSFIDQLVDAKLIDEERFALNYARGKFRIKEWGRLRIRAELKAKNIADSHIAKALGTIDPDLYKETLHKFALRKLESLAVGTSEIRRKKMWDAMIYRGWEKELVYEKIRELIP